MKDFLTQDHAIKFGSAGAFDTLPNQTGIALANEEVCAERAREGLRLVHLGEEKTMEGWIVYGAALNDGRRLFPSDNKFGQWVVNANLADTHPHDRLAAMWAAANPEDFTATKEAHPKVRTVRGLHAKFKAGLKAAQKVETRAPTLDDLRKVERLRALRDNPAATEGEKRAAQTKLDTIEKEIGKVEPSIREAKRKVVHTDLAQQAAEVVLSGVYESERACAIVKRAFLETYGKDEATLKKLVGILQQYRKA
ncbi:hypothetical protein [Ruegeria atlantica]|uniref:hypothetical protein n=1 Tax=Ruegeria atlantica TaxID=81569 RepID=UPI00147F48AA|nr:hypothetical protein [Ruegeria atlantica]